MNSILNEKAKELNEDIKILSDIISDMNFIIDGTFNLCRLDILKKLEENDLLDNSRMRLEEIRTNNLSFLGDRFYYWPTTTYKKKMIPSSVDYTWTCSDSAPWEYLKIEEVSEAIMELPEFMRRFDILYQELLEEKSLDDGDSIKFYKEKSEEVDSEEILNLRDLLIKEVNHVESAFDFAQRMGCKATYYRIMESIREKNTEIIMIEKMLKEIYSGGGYFYAIIPLHNNELRVEVYSSYKKDSK